VRPEDRARLEPWARFWHLWVSVVFLRGYLEAMGPGNLLPAGREELGVLLDFYLLKRAVNELRYELVKHPDRVTVPLRGLLQLLEAH
jgi:maltose alpha-D-glucosyltransferase/alpha-amylase